MVSSVVISWRCNNSCSVCFSHSRENCRVSSTTIRDCHYSSWYDCTMCNLCAKAWYCTISLWSLGVFKGGKLGLTLYKNCRFLLLLLFFLFFFAILKVHNWITHQQVFFIISRGCRLLWDMQRTVGLKCFPNEWKKHPCSWFFCSFFSLRRNLVFTISVKHCYFQQEW